MTITLRAWVVATIVLCNVAALGQTPEWMQDDAAAAAKAPSTTGEPDAAAQRARQAYGAGPVIEEYEITPRRAETVEERNAQVNAQPAVVAAPIANALPEPPFAPVDPLYGVQPSDVLQISVWHEPELQREVAVSPDGRINYPLIGSLYVEGKSVEQIGKEIAENLTTNFMKQADVTVTIKEVLGNRVYVLGQVNRPGAFSFTKSLDVTQALSLAGGAAKFAALSDIKILRRSDGALKTFAFDYGQVLKGRKLEQNILLENGDVVMVP